MKRRCNLSLNLQLAQHREAARLLDAQPVRRRTEFVVECILRYGHSVELEETVRTVIQEELRHFSGCQELPKQHVPAAVLRPDEAELSDIPDSLLHAMDDP